MDGSLTGNPEAASAVTVMMKHGRTGLVISLALLAAANASAQAPVRMQEGFHPGYQYQVVCQSDLNGTLTLPAESTSDKKPQTIRFTGSTSVTYDERVLDGDAKGPVQKTFRIYDRLDHRRKTGEQLEESRLRQVVRRLVLLRRQNVEIPFSPDGPLTLSEIDRVRMDVFTPALVGLLPGRDVRPGETWNAATEAVKELTDLEEIQSGGLRLQFIDVQTYGGRRVARVAVSGAVRGVNEEGPNRQEFQGHFLFDLDEQYLANLTFKGTLTILDKNDQPAGKIDGSFALTRRPTRKSDLSDAVVRFLDTEPTPENSALLFDEPAFGIRFVHPRRWTVRKADARQLLLETPEGGNLLITLEPLKSTPSGREFQAEALQSLREAKVQLRRIDEPRRVDTGHGSIESFQIDAETDQGRVILDYAVVRQAAGGATFAARYLAGEAASSRPEVLAIARSLRLIPPKR